MKHGRWLELGHRQGLGLYRIGATTVAPSRSAKVAEGIAPHIFDD